MKKAEITEDLKKSIIEFYLNNNTRSTLKKFGLRLSNLNWILDEANIEHHAITKTALTEDDIKNIIEEYKTQPDNYIIQKYHLTKARLKKLLEAYSIALHTTSENIQLAAYNKIKDKELEIIEFYSTNSNNTTKKFFGLNDWVLNFILAKNNIPLHTAQESTKFKTTAISKSLKNYYKINGAVSRPNKYKKQLSENELYSLIDYQKTHSDYNTQKYFKLTRTRYLEILAELRVSPHTRSENYALNNQLPIEKQLEIINYYKTHSDWNTKNTFNISEKHLFKILEANNITPHTRQENIAFGVEAQKETILQTYGVDNIQKLQSTKQKALETKRLKYGDENYINLNKIKQTCLKKYGVEWYTQSKVWKNKNKENSVGWRKKISETMAKNGTFCGSKTEDAFYALICEKFGIENIVRQYQDGRYPFACDFYIKPKDLFIELNITWTHGNHAFNKSNEEDLKKLNIWLEKSNKSDYYKNAIYTWTDLDVRKLDCFTKNSLNYLIFYNMQEALSWLDNLQVE